MKFRVGLLVVAVLAGFFLATFVNIQPREQALTGTTVKQITVTAFSTVTRYRTVEKPGFKLPTALLSTIVPDYENEETYHIIVPTVPGYHSTAQVEKGGDMVWIISYKPL